MASLGNILLEKEILLESGTNEVEILVFRVGGYSLGINVAKVREVLPAQEIAHLPKAHASIIGCFTLRDQVVPCVSLHRHLGETNTNKSDDAVIILTEFNQFQTAFVVDAVEKIHRVSWEQVMAAPCTITSAATPVTAVTDIEGRLISMLDFEMIADQVSEQAHRSKVVPNSRDLPRHKLRLLLADDSVTVRQAVAETLRGSGYTDLTTFENGEQAWNWIQQRFRKTGDVGQVADLLISDVEMPRIDGLHLTKNIKEHPELRKMCVLLYSSILTPDNRKKGAAVKADAMITKPEFAKVVEIADELIVKSRSCRQDNGTENRLDTVPDPPTHVAGAVVEILHGSSATQNTTDEPARAEQTTSNAETVVPPEVMENDAPTPTPPSVVMTVNDTAASSMPTDASFGTRLWITFRNELADRVDQLNKLCHLAADKVPNDEVINDALRVLHCIKSAAMVVPVDEVTQLTHNAEDLLSPLRQDKDRWPHAELNQYVGWLRELANPTYDKNEVEAVLADARRLEKEIAARARA